MLGRKEVNKLRKARKQEKLNERLLAKGKGPLFVEPPETPMDPEVVKVAVEVLEEMKVTLGKLREERGII